jgi:rod shape-determining protein MreC
MRSSDRRPRNWSDLVVRLFIFGLAALLLMALQISGNLQPVQSAITQLTSPAQLSATSITDSLTGFFQGLVQLRTLAQDKAALERINAQLEAEIDTLKEVEIENEQLRLLLDFAQARPRLELRGAQIVSRKIGEESTNFIDTIQIDLGTRQGVDIGMPVVTNNGLVGRVSAVNESVATILLLTDPSSSASAILADSRLNGVVRGDASGSLIMDFIPQGPTFQVGEVVLTSGLGGRFPKGIVIGTVTAIESVANAVFQKAIIAPSVDFGSLELVSVITNFDPAEILPDVPATPGVAPTAAPGATVTPEPPPAAAPAAARPLLPTPTATPAQP